MKKVKEKIPTNGLIKDLRNKFSILNGAKYFSLEIFQNYLVFIPSKTYMKYFINTRENLMECQKKVLKI